MVPFDGFPEIPAEQRAAPWIGHLITLFREQARTIQEQARTIQEQARTIQEQARIIQKQAEEIIILKKTVQELRDELNRLKKMPKRPKFRPNGDHSANRAGIEKLDRGLSYKNLL